MSDKTRNLGFDGLLLLYVLVAIIGICGVLIGYFYLAEHISAARSTPARPLAECINA
jgi:hypothetical protein